MARTEPQDTRNDEEEWQRQHRAELAAITQREEEAPPQQPDDLPKWVRSRGRPSPEEFGVTPEMGGMPQEADRTFAPSNVLSKNALAPYSDEVRRGLKNKKIERPNDVPEEFSAFDGIHDPIDGRVAVQRYLSDDRAGPEHKYAKPETETARHELLHALGSEHPAFKYDSVRNFHNLRRAIADDQHLRADPRYAAFWSAVDAYKSREDEELDWERRTSRRGQADTSTPGGPRAQTPLQSVQNHLFVDLLEKFPHRGQMPPTTTKYFSPALRTPTLPASGTNPDTLQADPVSGLSFLPAWIRAAGDAVGGFVGGGIAASPKLRTLFEGASWLGEHVSEPIVGAGTAVAADTAENLANAASGRAFGGSYEQTEAIRDLAQRRGGGVEGVVTAAREYGREVGERARQMREDPDAQLGQRAAALGLGAATVAADAALPIAPGAGPLVAGSKAAVRASGRAIRAADAAATEAAGPARLTPALAHGSPTAALPNTETTVSVNSPLRAAELAPSHGPTLEPGRAAGAPPSSGEVIPFPASPVSQPSAGGVNLGEALTRAQGNKAKRMERLVAKIHAGEKVSSREAEDLLGYLTDEVPDQAADFERILRPVIDEQAAIDIARKELTEAEKAARVADRDVLKVGNAEARAEQDVLRAEMNADRTQRRIDATEARTDVRRDLAYDGRLDKAATTGEEALERAAKNLDELRQADAAVTGQPVARVAYTLSAEDAERFARHGYSTPRDVEILNRSGLNIGKLDAEEAAQLAKTVRENPDEFEAVTKTVSHPEALQRAAAVLGAEPDALARELTRRGLSRGDQSGFLLGVNLTLTRLGKEYRALVETGASKADLDGAYARYVSFSAKVGGANSEAGRTLGVLRVQRTGAIVENIRVHNMQASTKRRVDDAPAAIAKAETAVKNATKDRETALAAVENARTDAARKAAERFAQQREAALAKAQTDLVAQQDKLKAAQADYAKAIEAASAAADKAHAAALVAATKGGVDAKAAKALLEIDPDDALALADAMRNLHKVTNGQRFATYFANNLYSGVQALEQNAIGAVLRSAERVALGPIARGVVAPTIRRISGEAPAFARSENLARDLAATVGTLPQAATAGMKTLLEGMDDASARAIDVLGPRPFRGKKGIAIEPALRLNAAADAMARATVGGIEMRGLALRHTERELGPKATADAIAARAAELIKNPTKEMLDEHARLVDGVNYGGKLGAWEEKVFAAINHRVGIPGLGATPALKILLGPVRFAWASTKFSGELTGLGLIRAYNLARKGPEFHRQAAISGARGMVGGTMLAAGLGFHSQGWLVGEDPEGKGRDDSMYVNGQWVPLRPFYPLSAPLIYAARVGDANARGEDAESKLGLGARGIAEAIGNQPVLRFTHDAYEAIYRQGNAAERFIAQLVSSRVLPDANAVRDIDRIIDNVVRDPEGFWQHATRNVPGLNRDLQPEIDTKGQPKRYPGGGGLERLNPFRSGYREPQAVDGALAAAGFSLSELGDEVSSTPLAPDEHTRWKVMGGQARYEAVSRVVNAPQFEGMSTSEKYKSIHAAAEAAIKEARLRLADELVASGDTGKQAKGIAIGLRATTSLNARAKLVEKLLPSVERDPALLAAVEAELRGRVAGPVHTGRVTHVVDGDTIRLEVPPGTKLPGADLRSFRLAAVDVPEANTPEGKRAAEALAAFLDGKKITFQAESADNFGRNLVALQADGVSVSDWLVQNGHAKPRLDDTNKYNLETYRRVIPHLRVIEAMPEYADKDGRPIGNPEIWKRVDQERAMHKEYEAKHGSFAANAKFPTYVAYRRYVPKNPKQVAYINDVEKQGIPLRRFVKSE